MRRSKSPFRVLAEGLIGGAIGAGVQTLFFRTTQSITPQNPPEAFSPPEAQQKTEMATSTVARRLVEGMAQRGPLQPEAKRRAGELVHYGFGAAWGGLYGLLRASYPAWRGPVGAGGYGAMVWMLSDNVLLPTMRLAGWPHRYPLRSHAYALAAHLAYGLGLWGSLVGMERLDSLAGLATLALARSALAGRRGLREAKRAVSRTESLVPRELIDGPRRLAERIARRAERRPS